MNRERRRAFSLIELMVVVTIILLLLGIGLSFGWGSHSSELQMTRAVLGNSQNLLDEYVVATGATGAALPTNTTTLVASLRSIGSLRGKLAVLPPAAFDPAGNSIIDGWGQVMNIRTAGRPSPYVVSAGPDGAFGTPDDIYSYKLGIP